MAKALGVDSLKYLSQRGMLRAMMLKGSDFCAACFTGKYPERVEGKNLCRK